MTHFSSELDDSQTLRLVWPQWQGAGRDNVSALLPEFPYEHARRGYAVGSKVLNAILPEHSGPTEFVAVNDDDSEGTTNGVESLGVVTDSLKSALSAIDRHNPRRVLTLGGECSVSVAPFSKLAAEYGDDLAVIWIDSHPDSDTPDTHYNGYHAMAVSTLLGQGDASITDLLPATISPSRIAYAALHDWEEDAYENVGKWELPVFSPDDLRESSDALIGWLKNTGASKVAIHLDVDVVDSNEIALGLGQVPDGLSRSQVQRLVIDISEAADVVGLTIAEFIPRDVLAMHGLLEGMPLVAQTQKR